MVVDLLEPSHKDLFNYSSRDFSLKTVLMLGDLPLSQICYARVLNRFAEDTLQAMRETINKVCKSIKVVKFSEYHERKPCLDIC